MILDLLLIQVIIVYCIDMSGFVEEVTSKIHSWLTNGRNTKPFVIKPIFCSRCDMFWIGLIYILVLHEFTLFNVFIVAMLSLATPITYNILQTTYNIILKIIDLINEKIYDN